MGIYDREYYREEESTGFGLGGSGQSAAMQLLAINIVVYIACIISQPIADTLMLHGDTYLRPWMWWQFVSYAFVHDLGSGAHIVTNLLGIWFFGTEIEQVYGKKSFLKLFFGAVVIGSIVWSIRQYLLLPADADPAVLARYGLLGASGGVTAIVILFCLKFPQRIVHLMFVIPVPAWILGLLLVIGNVLGDRSTMGEAGIAYDVHLVGVAVAFVFFRYGHRLGGYASSSGSARSSGSTRRPRSGAGSWFSWLKPKPNLRIHHPDEVEDDMIDPEVDYEELDRRGDEILQKWHREGEDSLDAEERRILEAYSRRMKQKHR